MSTDYSVPIPWRRISYSLIAFVSLVMMYLLPGDRPFRFVMYGIGSTIGSFYFAKSSIKHILSKHKVTTDVIMTLAVIGAAILGAFEESLTIVFLYSITETLESYTVRRTKSTIKSLIKLVPKEVTKVDDGIETTVAVDNLSTGDILRIRVGDKIPADGEIIKGSAAIDESSITGEPIPAYKTIDDTVMSGTICSDGSIDYQVTKLPSESTVSKIIELVEQAQANKVPAQLTIERFTRYYNPGILIFSILVFIVPSLITAEIKVWAILAVTLLVASSPCALAISSPVTMYSAISAAANKGILVKGGAFLEELGNIDAIVFDKTGTLTYGEPILTDIITTADIEENDLLQIAGSLEMYSNHPIAKTVSTTMIDRELAKLDVENHSTLPGQGIAATIHSKQYYFGSKEAKDVDSYEEQVATMKSRGKSIAYLLENEKLIGIFGFEDKVRDSVRDAVKEIQERNIPIFMFTGDNKEAALKIGQQLDIDETHIHYSMSPDMKMKKIEELGQKYILAMIGDGINDAPALAQADIGVAMGIAGTDVALEVADIAIMSDEVVQFVRSINIGRQMKSIITQNIIVSTLILIFLLIGVLIGRVNITQAILIHEGTEVLIVLNAMKLFFKSM